MSGKKTTISSIVDVPESVTIHHALAELDRELGVRQRIYDRWVSEGKIAYVDAVDRYSRLLLACQTVRRMADLQEVN